jgi:hypothetical protein
MLRAAKIAAVCGAACATVAVAGRVYYGGWTWPANKAVVRLRFWMQPTFREQLKMYYENSSAPFIRETEYERLPPELAETLTLESVNIISTTNPERVQHQLHATLADLLVPKGFEVFVLHKYKWWPNSIYDDILHGLGVVPAPKHLSWPRFLAIAVAGAPDTTEEILENCLPNDSCLIVHDWEFICFDSEHPPVPRRTTMPLSKRSNFYINKLQQMCNRKRITLIIVERKR